MLAQEIRTCKKCGPQTLDKFYHVKEKKGLRLRCKACNIAQSIRYAKQNRSKCLARYKRIREARRLKVLQYYSGNEKPFCFCCKEDTLQFLVLDHKNGGGNKHRKQLKGGADIYSWVEKNNYPPLFRILCHNCNQSYGSYGFCPHQQTSGVDAG
jgi:hypothetical protein